MTSLAIRLASLTLLLASAGGCSSSSGSIPSDDAGGSGAVASPETAKAAYLGLDASIDKAITLGFAGFNSASSANISAQTTNGASSGTMTITGQVDQGKSANKQMRLLEQLAAYSDDGKTTYATSTNATLNMSLQGIPNGTLTGSLNGSYTMSGQLTGTVTLAVTFTGQLQPGSPGVSRKPGTTHITGTATSPYGTYAIDVTR